MQDPPEEEMATHFSTVAWETPWTEESGRLQSMASKDSQTGLSEHAHMHLIPGSLSSLTVFYSKPLSLCPAKPTFH